MALWVGQVFIQAVARPAPAANLAVRALPAHRRVATDTNPACVAGADASGEVARAPGRAVRVHTRAPFLLASVAPIALCGLWAHTFRLRAVTNAVTRQRAILAVEAGIALALVVNWIVHALPRGAFE